MRRPPLADGKAHEQPRCQKEAVGGEGAIAGKFQENGGRIGEILRIAKYHLVTGCYQKLFPVNIRTRFREIAEIESKS